MSITNNSYVPVAATAAGVTVAPGASPIVEQLLDNIAVSAVKAAEVTSKGKCIVLVEVDKAGGGKEYRPVASATGDVKLFANGQAVVALAKKSNLPGGQSVAIVKMSVTASVGDPIAMLKSQHRAAVREAASTAKPVADLAQKITGAEALGWDTDPVGSATRAQFDDLTARQVTVAEWHDAIAARVNTLAAALTAAGIDPNTYLPIASGG